MLILGIDPGTGRTGWGVVSHTEGEDKVVYVAHGCVTTKAEDPMPNRLLELHTEIKNIVKKYKPECMIVEQIFFGINSRTAISVSQARGVSLLIAASENLPFFEYTSLQVKYLVAGSGRTEKNEMKKVVRRLLSKNERTLSFSAKDKGFDDAADALAIAIHHSFKLNGKDKILQDKKEEEKRKKKEESRKKKEESRKRKIE